MVKAHTPINWENEPSHNTPINETNLNKMDKTIGVLDDRIIEQETSKLDKSTAYTMVKDISFNENNGVFTVTRLNGSTFTIDTRLEKIAINFKYDYSTQKLIVTLIDGTTQSIDMSALVTQYEFADSATLDFTTDSNGKVTATIKSGSITEDMLQPNYLAEIKVETAKSAQSMANAKISENNAKQSELNAKASEEQALEYSNNAQPLAQSVSGNNPTATNSTDGKVIHLKNSGYTEQKKLVFDGSVTATTSGIKNTNPIPCKKGDSISVTAGVETGQIIISTVSGESRLYPGVVVPGYYLEFTLDIDTGGGIYIEIYKKNDTPKFEEVTVNGSAYATPSPDNPIHIGGLADKGYFDDELLQGSRSSADGSFSNSSLHLTSANGIECKENDIVKVSYEEKAVMSIIFYDENMNHVSGSYIDNENYEYEQTAPENAKYVYFNIYTGATLTPSTAKHISVTINGQYAVRVKTVGKNLFNKDNVTINKYLNSTGGISSGGDAYCISDYIYVGNGDFVVDGNDVASVYWHTFDKNNNLIRAVGIIPSTGRKISLTGEEVKLRMTLLTAELDSTMLRRAIDTSDYEPYQETTALIPVSAPFYEGDYIEVYADGTGREYRKMSSVVYDGSESGWTLGGSTSGLFYILKPTDAKPSPTSLLCSHYIKSASATGYTTDKTTNINAGNYWVIDNRFTSVDDFKAWLQSNPIHVLYEKAEPTSTPLTAEQVAAFLKLRTYKGVTHVTADGEVVMRYYVDNASGDSVSMLHKQLDLYRVLEVARNAWYAGGTIHYYGMGVDNLNVLYPPSIAYNNRAYLDVLTGYVYICHQTGQTTYGWVHEADAVKAYKALYDIEVRLVALEDKLEAIWNLDDNGTAGSGSGVEE